MPTLAIGTSISRTGGPRAAAGGFSLLELLVVVAIIGIFVGAVVLSMDITGRDRESEREVIRLRGLIDLVREEALMQSRDYGILFNEKSYRFYVYDYQQLAWLLPADDRLLAEHSVGEQLNIELTIEDRDVVLNLDTEGEDDDAPEPQVVILSSGELTPFEVEVFRDYSDGRYVLTAELDGSLEVAPRGFEPR